MRSLPLSILILLGIAHAKMQPVSLTVKDKPMLSWRLYTPFEDCFVRYTESLSVFSKHLYKGRLFGPCRYMMYRTYEGNITKEVGTGSSQFTINLQAPKGMSTYIDSIYFQRMVEGSGCSSFKMSQVPQKWNEEPRYFTIQAESDKVPNYEFSLSTDIEGGKYMLDIPNTCLADGSVRIRTIHVYEDVARQLVPIGGSGRFHINNKGCALWREKPQINSYKKYVQILKNWPRVCAYAYEREYRWIPPVTHVLVKDGKTIVMAQIQLHEPMLPDQARMITRLTLGSVRGESCKDAILYAQEKPPFDQKAEKLRHLKVRNGLLTVRLPLESLADTSRDFVFELPPDCKIGNPVLTMRVIDQDAQPRNQSQVH